MSHRRFVAALAALVLPVLAAGPLVAAEPAAASTITYAGINDYGGETANDQLTLYASVTAYGATPTGTFTVTDDSGALVAQDVAAEHGVAQIVTPAGPAEATVYTVTFHGTDGYADSTGSVTHYLTVDPVLEPDVILKRTSGERHQLMVGAKLTNADGSPLANRVLRFSLGAPYGPDGTLPKGGRALCSVLTLRSGYADCPGEVLGESLLAVVMGGYVSYVVPGHPELYRSARLRLV